MAGDWIKMRVGLLSDPAVIAMAEDLRTDEFRVVGMLLKFWAWGDQHLADGNAPRVTKTWLDGYVGVAGFAAALQNAGWLLVENGGISIPKFERHNSKPAKHRALTQKRVARSRNARVTHGALPEKRREEKNSPLLTSPGGADSRFELQPGDPPNGRKRKGGPSKVDPWACAVAAMTNGTLNTPRFEAAWRAWATYRDEDRRKPLTRRAIEMQIRKLEPAGEAGAIKALETAEMNSWIGIFPDEFGHTSRRGGAGGVDDQSKVRSGDYDQVKPDLTIDNRAGTNDLGRAADAAGQVPDTR